MSWIEKNIPEVADAFSDLAGAIYENGELDAKTKDLISIAASVLMRCEDCIRVHTRLAKEHGATDRQIAEAIACVMFVAAGSQWAWSDIYDEIMPNKSEDMSKSEDVSKSEGMRESENICEP